MSILPRAPAWAALRPSSPSFEEIDDERARLIRLLVAGTSHIARMGSSAGGLEGFYRLGGERDLFVKVVSPHHFSRQLQADRIARFLASQGVATVPCLDGFPRHIPGRAIVFAFPFLEARFARADRADLGRLGQALGRLHVALAHAPFADGARQRSRERDASLRRYRTTPLARPDDRVEAVLAADDTDHVDAECQPVHGDVNYVNVLFPIDDGEPVLLDFEDCAFSHLPRLVDVAMAVERFALTAAPEDDARALVLARALTAGYQSADPRPLAPAEGALASTLRTLSVRALSLLCEMERGGQAVAPFERGKFLCLHGEAIRRADLLSRIEEDLA